GLLLTMVAKVSNFMVERWIVSQEEDREESRRRVSASKREQNALAARRKGQVFGWVTEMFLRLAGTLMLQKHGRCHEFQSDMVGMKYAQFAGYDPRGAIWLQKLFVQMHGDRSIPVVELFASHPPSKDRVERCEHTYHRLQNGETDSIY
ncbi:MAG: M48 family metalloprotease, partial [Chlamydiia bacterium]|nr:M48 family metalloprotease [Chlamydiia bacterium]